MSSRNNFKIASLGLAISLFTMGCNSQSDKKTEKEVVMTQEPTVAEADMASVKAEIQALETEWAAADNSRDANAIIAFFSDDAISMTNNAPMTVGKANLQKEIEAGLAKKAEGETVAYTTLEVFGDENTVTEIGKSESKDASGKVIRTGKYMAIWQMRDGKYVCIRDIYNDDAVIK